MFVPLLKFLVFLFMFLSCLLKRENKNKTVKHFSFVVVVVLFLNRENKTNHFPSAPYTLLHTQWAV